MDLFLWFTDASVQIAVLRFSDAWSVGPTMRRLLRFGSMWASGSGVQALLSHMPLMQLLTPPGLFASLQSLVMFIAWGSGIVTIFLLARDEAQVRNAAATLRLRALQAEQHAARRRVVEAELRAIQSRVDPGMFFAVLDAVQGLYGSDAARAEGLLDQLVVFLRAALPRLSAPSSSLAQELELLDAYARLRSLAGMASAELRIDVPEVLAAQAFPSGVLLPVLAGLVGQANSATERVVLDIGHDLLSAELTLVFSCSNELPLEARARVAETLDALYGTEARIKSIGLPPATIHTRITIRHDGR